jgi:uncharacterized protein involved in exopolysaccharide biosynthesis
LLSTYEDALAKYTPRHPEVTKVGTQIVELLGRIGTALQSDMNRQRSRLVELRAERAKIVDNLLSSSIEQEEQKDKQSNYSIYQRLYNEMKVKLEEAQITLALGRNDESRYTIIDPALEPLFPSKPSRILIIAGGIAMGLVLGVVAVIVAELMDTTIRTPGEVIVFRKPIIGLLPDSRKRNKADYYEF